MHGARAQRSLGKPAGNSPSSCVGHGDVLVLLVSASGGKDGVL